MFYKQTINDMLIKYAAHFNTKLDEIERKYETQQKRINKISDYIQKELLNELIKADNKFIMETFDKFYKEKINKHFKDQQLKKKGK